MLVQQALNKAMMEAVEFVHAEGWLSLIHI